jgi:hypothetical protein
MTVLMAAGIATSSNVVVTPLRKEWRTENCTTQLAKRDQLLAAVRTAKAAGASSHLPYYDPSQPLSFVSLLADKYASFHYVPSDQLFASSPTTDNDNKATATATNSVSLDHTLLHQNGFNVLRTQGYFQFDVVLQPCSYTTISYLYQSL